MTQATRSELILETIGAVAAAAVLISLFWSGDEVAPLLAAAVGAVTATVGELVSFIPRLAQVGVPDWYASLVVLSAAASLCQFRLARDMGFLEPAKTGGEAVVHFLLGAAYVCVAAYTLVGLAILALQILILRGGLSFYLNSRFDGPPDEMEGAVSNALGSFYFIFVTFALVAAFYAVNALAL